MVVRLFTTADLASVNKGPFAMLSKTRAPHLLLPSPAIRLE
jgi:hypothetical protein